MDYTKDSTTGLYDELDRCRSYGSSILSPPEEATTTGIDRAGARYDAVKAELDRRAAGVLVGQIRPLRGAELDIDDSWEVIPPWSRKVPCVEVPRVEGGFDLVSFSDGLSAGGYAENFNSSATEEFIDRVGPARVVERSPDAR